MYKYTWTYFIYNYICLYIIIYVYIYFYIFLYKKFFTELEYPPRILMKLGLFDTFLCETKDLAEKRGGLPRETSYDSLKLTNIEIRKSVRLKKNSNMNMLCDYLRMLRDHFAHALWPHHAP